MVKPFHRSIAVKLFAAVLAATIPVVALMIALEWSASRVGLDHYLDEIDLEAARPVAALLGTAWRASRTWDFVPRSAPAFHDWLHDRMAPGPTEAGQFPPGRPPPGGALVPGAALPYPPPGTAGLPPPPPGGDAPPLPQSGIDRRISLLDAEGRLIVGPPGSDHNPARVPIVVDGKIVGQVSFAPAAYPSTPVERHFLAEQQDHLIVVAGLAVVLSGLAGGLMARHIVGPLQGLVAATARLAEGDYGARLDTGRQDELGALAVSFNALGAALAAHEESRRRFVADTSHELRTPIAVLRAQVEALQDGIHKADQATLAVLHDEVMGLSKLVDDLYTLARADVSGLTLAALPVDPIRLLEDVLDSFRSRLAAAGLTVSLAGTPPEPWVSLGDERALRQLFANLVENTVRYTDAGGALAIRTIVKPNMLVVRFDDTPPGVADADLPRLFERFFRVESSRNRDQGGSGLGLAICRSIAEAHNGRILATGSPMGGLRIEVVLPKRGEVNA